MLVRKKNERIAAVARIAGQVLWAGVAAAFLWFEGSHWLEAYRWGLDTTSYRDACVAAVAIAFLYAVARLGPAYVMRYRHTQTDQKGKTQPR